jgi:hypothetical protein
MGAETYGRSTNDQRSHVDLQAEPPKETTAYSDHIAQNIRDHGVFLQFVGGDPEALSTSFGYTVGLFEVGHPELLILGVTPGTASGVLNDVARRVRADRALTPGEVLTFDSWPHRVAVEVLPNPQAILFVANDFYERTDDLSVPAYQLTYDDRSGRFPWDAGYDVPPWIQPRPGEFTA